MYVYDNVNVNDDDSHAGLNQAETIRFVVILLWIRLADSLMAFFFGAYTYTIT